MAPYSHKVSLQAASTGINTGIHTSAIPGSHSGEEAQAQEQEDGQERVEQVHEVQESSHERMRTVLAK